MKPIIKEKYRDTPGVIYRFVCISRIKNNTHRRLAMALAFPFFLAFNCMCILPVIAAAWWLNSIELILTVIKRWNHPAQEKN